MSVLPPRFQRVSVTNIVPSATWDEDDGSGDPWLYFDYRWTLTLNVDVQSHSSHRTPSPFEYNGSDIKVGDWIASSEGGIAVKIVGITSQNISQVVCEVEDVDRYNLFNDNSLSGIGIGPEGVGYVFELNDDGMPILTPSITGTLGQNFQNDLIGRFQDRNLKRKYYKVTQNAHGLGSDDVIYLDSSDGLYKAAQSSSALPVVGVVREAFSYANNSTLDWFAFEPIGKIVELENALPGNKGDFLYVSDTVAGGLVNVKPNDVAKPIYIKLDTNIGLLIDRNAQEKSAATTLVADIAARDALAAKEGDQAFVEDRGDGEWAKYLFDGTNWILIATQDSAQTDSNTQSVTVMTANVSPSDIAVVSDGTRVVLVTVHVTEAFDDLNAYLNIGDDADNERLMSDNDLDLSVVGVYETSTSHQFNTGGNVTIRSYYDLGTSISGSVTITISYA